MMLTAVMLVGLGSGTHAMPTPASFGAEIATCETALVMKAGVKRLQDEGYTARTDLGIDKLIINEPLYAEFRNYTSVTGLDDVAKDLLHSTDFGPFAAEIHGDIDGRAAHAFAVAVGVYNILPELHLEAEVVAAYQSGIERFIDAAIEERATVVQEISDKTVDKP